MQTLVNRHITRLDALTPADEPRSGAKAFNCARLKQAGFPVPDGLVVLATAADEDFQSIGGDPWFDGLSRDEVFAVRSSGIGEDGHGQSFAGIHETLLDVRREDRILQHERHRALSMPLLMRESELPALIRMAGVSGGSGSERELTGQAVSGDAWKGKSSSFATLVISRA